MLGGYPNAELNQKDSDIRKDIFQVVLGLGEGVIFREDELNLSPEEAVVFHKLRGHDYLHLNDGFLVGVVETKHLRRAPHIDALMRSYSKRFQVALRETGDRIAWRAGMKKWEPIQGYRFYTTGSDNTLMFGRMTIRLVHAPDYVMNKDILPDQALALLDTFSDKDFERDLSQWARTVDNWEDQISVARTSMVMPPVYEAPDDDGHQVGFFDAPGCVASLTRILASKKPPKSS